MEDCRDSDILVVTTTVATREQAAAIMTRLLEARLAACVQLEDILSHYRWNGRVQVDAEVRLTIKSACAHRQALEAAVSEGHPYELPQIVAWTASASPAYAAWIREETTPVS